MNCLAKVFSTATLLLCCVIVTAAQSAATDRIQRAGGLFQIEQDGGLRVAPRAGRGVLVPSTCAGAPVSLPATARFCYDAPTATMRISYNGQPYINWSSIGGSGTVTSVGLTLPPALFSLSGSPITTSGTLAASLVSQPANQLFASPNGAAGTPGFRSLVSDDIPTLTTSKITSGVFGIARGGTGLNSYTFGDLLYADGTGVLARLAGNTTTAKRFLTQTGDGTFSGVPAWNLLTSGDVPAVNLAGGNVNGGVFGTLPIGSGGTGLTALGGANTLMGVNSTNTGIAFKTLSAGSNIAISQVNDVITISASGTTGISWSNIANPATNLALQHGSNTTSFTWGTTPASTNLFTLSDATNNTGTGYLFNLNSASGSAISPARITANGNGVELTNTGLLRTLGTGAITATSVSTGGTEGLLEQTGDTYGATRLRLQNRVGSNGALFENAGLNLVDFGFRAANGSQRSLRFEARETNTFAGTPEFQIGTADDPSVAIADGLVLFRKNVRITPYNSAGNGVEIASGGTLQAIGAGSINATQLRGVSVSTTAPAVGQTLVYDGSSYTPTNQTSAADPAQSLVVEEFAGGTETSGTIGVLGWMISGVGTFTNDAGDANHPNFINRNGAGSSNPSGIHTQILFPTTANFNITFIVRGTDQIGTSWTSSLTRIGLCVGAGGSSDGRGIYFNRAGGSWVGHNQTGATTGVTQTGAIASSVSGTWYKLTMRRIAANQVGFSVNNGAETVLTATAPAQNLNLCSQASSTNTTNFATDFMSVQMTGLTRF